ncbi:DUF3027 domain-containing protein [Brevibacterium jeotgali]|uniref:DUF3027 domain-containing protein n=1 Tax=Brevibacterium jeotgali TaxID=1262550 RepID=A0A2H1L437_9MICO|nr:DUF3027 domain-containing protein [Brevibacterium jeotgali]TWB98744.1 DUF3027 family protein [Brevibacterium jeotgali]SMY11656.1 Protein of unknown function (DUF3027) [Brevibacterium jeotgali]
MSGLFDRWLASAEATSPTATTRAAGAAEAAESSEATTTSATDAPTARERRQPRRPTAIVLDTVLAEAVDVARAAITEVAGESEVGAHLGVVAEDTRLVTHSFACTNPAYRGWHWVAVLARAPRAKKTTVCETALLPGADALVAPAWMPWDERVRPGDMRPKDVLPKAEDDPNLDLGLEQVDVRPGDDIDQVPNFEYGLGRTRVLSREGIASAAQRWVESDAGPEGEFAREARGQCSTCGFLLPIAGSMRTRFGVCANKWAPFDGRIVALDSGCGAHSETDVQRRSTEPASSVVDDFDESLDIVEHVGARPEEAHSRG